MLGVRPEVLASWSRSRSFGVDPEAGGPPVELTGDGLLAYREQHPLSAVMPVVRQLLVGPAAADNLIVAVSDADGTLLWVEGASAARGRAERMRFTEGARWDERHAGTNAPGLALAVDYGVHVRSAEHWARPVHPWSCSARPVHDPADGRVLGAVDVTGDARAASRGVFALVTATVAAAERELEIALLRAAAGSGSAMGAGAGSGAGMAPESALLRLSVLRPGGPSLTVRGRRVSVSQRHAELLLLLAEHPEGMTAEALTVLLDERALDPVTVRAEMTRLRRVVGPDAVRSRPYRLGVPVATDVADVRRLLAGAELRSRARACGPGRCCRGRSRRAWRPCGIGCARRPGWRCCDGPTRRCCCAGPTGRTAPTTSRSGTPAGGCCRQALTRPRRSLASVSSIAGSDRSAR